MLTFLCLFVGIGLLFVALGVPLWRRRVRRNLWYGLRVRETLADDEVWYEANVACGKQCVGGGAALALLAVALYFVPWSDPEDYAMLLFGVVLAGTLSMAFAGIETAKAISKRVRDAEAERD